MLDITRMLTDKKFRKDTLSYSKDTVVLQFWNVEFNSWTEKFQSEAIAPVLNKVGAFTANPVIRNIIGQPKSTFNIREMMDGGKILIVNLSKGLIGEDNASILGAFLVTKIQLAAMSRSDIASIEDRRPFYLYVDEFQNFATDSFATILSEARKYGLNLTVANQYISQMNETVRDAVFGNVGTMISFRVSADDAPILGKQFEPQFEPNDLLQMHNRHFIINMVISGEKSPAFSATTLTLPEPQTDVTPQIIEHTRHNYSRSREEVEEEISMNISPPQPQQQQQQQQPKPAAPRPERPRPAQPTPAPQPQQPAGEKREESRPHSHPQPQPAPTPAPAITPAPTEPRQDAASPEDAPAKKKRTRSRRKKSGAGGQPTDTDSPEAPQAHRNHRENDDTHPEKHHQPHQDKAPEKAPERPVEPRTHHNNDDHHDKPAPRPKPEATTDAKPQERRREERRERPERPEQPKPAPAKSPLIHDPTKLKIRHSNDARPATSRPTPAARPEQPNPEHHAPTPKPREDENILRLR
jgi:hypothetical protein